MAELNFSKLERLTTQIEESNNDAAKAALENIKSEYADVFEAASSRNNALTTDNDSALAEDDLERVILDNLPGPPLWRPAAASCLQHAPLPVAAPALEIAPLLL